MAKYRISRNIERSFLDQIKDLLPDGDWENVRVEKTFVDAYKKGSDGSFLLPCIVINVLESRAKRLEISSKTYLKYITVNFRVFGTDDGNRLDLKDWLFEQIENYDFIYYTYEIVDNIPMGTEAGKIVITKIFDDKKEMQNSETLVQADKFRHIISCEVMVVLS